MITLIATAKFGLEKMVRLEVEALGFGDVAVSPGRIAFAATLADIPRLNVWLRCADRLLLKVAEFPATTFDELFEGCKGVAWEQWIGENGRFPVTAHSVKSTLMSERSCQSIVKKAVVDRLSGAYGVAWLAETGGEYAIHLSLHKDVALLTLDTSGAGLHKRGYREEAGEAPLKETLAAALVKLSFWRPDRLMLDPMCGSGTILIEAAMMARRMAPGGKRPFAAEQWPIIPAAAWESARQEAETAVRPSGQLQLFGYDIDPATIEIAKSNAAKAGVADDIVFAVKDVRELWIDQQYGIVITNPPYGVRMAEYQTLNQIYLAFNRMFRKKQGWSVYVLTADHKFPDYFKRAQPDRVRKLYNGKIEANYYQYYGEKPPEN